MINHLPERRTLAEDVRLRARQRLSEGLLPASRNGRLILIAVGVSQLAAGADFAGKFVHGGNAQLGGHAYQYSG
jgi:hypothetical protein